MSIWGPKPVENDDASDWVDDLVDDPGLDVIEEALTEVADPANVGYMDIDAACIAVVAAQVWSEVMSAPGADPVLEEDDLAPLRARREKAEPEEVQLLTRSALFAARRVVEDQDNSELFDVWNAEGDAMRPWLEGMRDLQTRLESIDAALQSGGADEPSE